jgi:hypothetical protein
MQVIWRLETNYNCEKNEKKQHKITIATVSSRFTFDCGVSVKSVIINANGAKVKIRISLLLLGEIRKTAIPIKKAATIFL